jgi:hypothetical protein
MQQSEIFRKVAINSLSQFVKVGKKLNIDFGVNPHKINPSKKNNLKKLFL